MLSKTLLLLFCISRLGFAEFSGDQTHLAKIFKDKKFLKLREQAIQHAKKGWCSEEQANLLIDFVLLTKPQVCVEVGAFRGDHFLPIAAAVSYLKKGHAYAIDAWSNEEAVKGVSPEDVNYQAWMTTDMIQAKESLLSKIQSWKLNRHCTVIHAPSEKAAPQIDKIDFLHLLGGLSEDECLKNVELFLPKVKHGGHILLSNVFLYIDNKLTRMKSLWALLDQCEVVCEIENSNAILLRKMSSSPVSSTEMSYLYQKNCISAETPYETQVVNHVKTSYEKARRLESKLKCKRFAKGALSRGSGAVDYTSLKNLTVRPYYHLLNNLCELKGASHLHVGLLAGDSFVAALYGNQSNLKGQIGLDWFQECPENLFIDNCKEHIDLSKCSIINGECFDIDKSKLGSPIDIYLYDADHSLTAQERAITYYHDTFANVFTVVIDDWECPWIRKPTFKAFDKLNYHILYEAYIPGPSQYKRGQYVAVIKKSV